jgi:tryptophan synthase alpha chain
MNRYTALQKRISETRIPAYLPYVLLGYPTKERTVDVCRVLADGGVDGLELGLPFRDPVADGPLIQAAANETLDYGFTTADAVDLVREIRKMVPNTPLTLMAYYNMVIARGAESFIADFSTAGIDGLLVPDLPVERAEELIPIAQKHGIVLIFIASPLSDERRLKMLGAAGGGFTYVVTRLGITGVDAHYATALDGLFSRIHDTIPLPAFAGFGISEPEHVTKMVAAGADGVIIGSRLVQLIQAANDENWNLAALAAHTRSIIDTLRGLKTIRSR